MAEEFSSIPQAPASGSARKPQVIIITGPTAVGKTAVGLALAQRIGGEIISADSVQVYRGLNIGADKLPLEERQGIPHHLLDIKDPTEAFTAGDFHDEARAATEDILSRGKVPIVVGGTGFYLRWFVHGKAQSAKSSPEVLAAVHAAMKQAQAAAAAASPTDLTDDQVWNATVQLARDWGDPVTADRILLERNNYYRLERALCILHMHPGKTLAELDLNTAAPLPYDFRAYFLHRPRLELYDRIVTRIEQMVCGGLLDEADMLLSRGLRPGLQAGLHPEVSSAQSMAAKAIGFRQAMEFLLDKRASGKPAVVSELIALVGTISAATHKLVRNQMTWFRDDPMYRWVDMAVQDAAATVEAMHKQLQQEEHQGGNCGQSGRLSKEEEKALIRYRPQMHLLLQPRKVEALLRHVNTVLLAPSTCTQAGGSHVSSTLQHVNIRPGASAISAPAAEAAAAAATTAINMPEVSEALQPHVCSPNSAQATGAAGCGSPPSSSVGVACAGVSPLHDPCLCESGLAAGGAGTALPALDSSGMPQQNSSDPQAVRQSV